MKVLVDTSIWSLALRRRPGDLNPNENLLVTELTELIQEGRAAIIGLIRQELLSGIKRSAQVTKVNGTGPVEGFVLDLAAVCDPLDS
jgi:hypothetical protein